ncbi:MAG: hypothetical protein NVSMB51_01770 [Solirubrobacteraceae bacterium]
MDVLNPPAPATDPFGTRKRQSRLRQRAGAAGAALLALLAKLKVVLLALGKIKFLTTSGTALLSVLAYSLFWGWQFAAGFVALIFVHEMGHVIQLRREGIKASAPMFIPGFGAVVWAKSLGENATAEARVGLAGPILGSIGAGLVAIAAVLTGSDLLRALAYTGFFINLFNLIPVVPLDGGRAVAALSPRAWLVGLPLLVLVTLLYPNIFLIVITFLCAMETWRRWKAHRSRTLESAAYYRVSPRARMLVATVYLGLIALLALGMQATYIQRSL